jgi:hypothetical protein
MNCPEFNDLFSPYLDGVIKSPDREQLEKHLERCGACKAELEILKKMDALVETHLAETVVPRRFAAEVLEQIRETGEKKTARIFRFFTWKTALSAAVILFILMIPVYRATLSADAQLQSIQTQVDQISMTESHAIWTESMMAQFEVSETLVESLRQKGHGWGEILILLTAAQHISLSQPDRYDTLDDALADIEPSRKQGKNWSSIGRELRFDLSPVIRQAERRRDDLRIIGREIKQKKDDIKNKIREHPFNVGNDIMTSNETEKSEVPSFKDKLKKENKDVNKQAKEIKKVASDSKKEAGEASRQAKDSKRDAKENARDVKEQVKQDIQAAREDAQEAKKDSKENAKAARQELKELRKENKEKAK